MVTNGLIVFVLLLHGSDICLRVIALDVLIYIIFQIVDDRQMLRTDFLTLLTADAGGSRASALFHVVHVVERLGLRQARIVQAQPVQVVVQGEVVGNVDVLRTLYFTCLLYTSDAADD